jgi:hypothetical protein
VTRRLTLALAVSSLLVPAASASAAQRPLHPGAAVFSAAAKKKKAATPVISSISPKKAKVGDKLTIKGKNFLSGASKNRVFFYRVGGGSTWVKAEKASKTKIVVTIPDKLQTLLPGDGKQARVQLRILSKKFGALSKPSISPLLAIKPADKGGDSGQGGGGTTPGVTVCTPVPDNPASDVDLDGLSDGKELAVGLDPCNKDSDGDGPTDGYEYNSAIDLNSAAVPYPAKRPYPNPLFADADIDYDGDGLTTADEFALWTKFGGSAFPMNYSAGKQYTNPQPAPDPNGPYYYQDLNGNGVLSDDELDADGDGLGNWDESHGRMIPEWWDATYSKDPIKETPYLVRFAPPSMLDADSDGDGIPDGADDQDFDGLSNSWEVERPGDWSITYVATGYGVHNYDPSTNLATDPDQSIFPGYHFRYYSRVQPFNPCKPVWSSVCHLHYPFSYYPETEKWMGWGVPGMNQPIPAPGVRPGDV